MTKRATGATTRTRSSSQNFEKSVQDYEENLIEESDEDEVGEEEKEEKQPPKRVKKLSTRALQEDGQFYSSDLLDDDLDEEENLILSEEESESHQSTVSKKIKQRKEHQKVDISSKTVTTRSQTKKKQINLYPKLPCDDLDDAGRFELKKPVRSSKVVDQSLPEVVKEKKVFGWFGLILCFAFFLPVVIALLIPYSSLIWGSLGSPSQRLDTFNSLLKKHQSIFDSSSVRVILNSIQSRILKEPDETTVLLLMYTTETEQSTYNFLDDFIKFIRESYAVQGSEPPPIVRLDEIKQNHLFSVDSKMTKFLKEDHILVLQGLEHMNLKFYKLLYKYIDHDPLVVPAGYVVILLKLPTMPSPPYNILETERASRNYLLPKWKSILSEDTIFAFFSRFSYTALVSANHTPSD